MKEALPPYSLENEEACLGSILIDSDALTVVNLKPEDFFSEQNQLIFQAMLKLGDGINELTVAQTLVDMGKLDDAGGASYLVSLVSLVPTSLHAEYYANIVRKCAVNRRLISLAQQIEGVGYKNEEPQEALDFVQNLLGTLSRSTYNDTLITPKQLATLGMNRYAKLEKGMGQSVLTGIQELDMETGGAFAGELWILGGRAGLGKTTMLLQIAESMSRNGNVLFASLEMNWRGILDRMVASRLSIHPRSLRVGSYSEPFMKQIVDTMPIISDTNIYLFGKGLTTGGGITTDTLLREATKMKMTYGLSAIAVDYLGLFADEGKNLYEKTSYISGRLKRISETLEVPIICAAQLSRVNEQQHGQSNHRPTLTSLRDSGSVEQDADVVLFLYRDDYYREIREEHPECNGQAELILAKQRQGESNITFSIRWNSDRRCYE